MRDTFAMVPLLAKNDRRYVSVKLEFAESAEKSMPYDAYVALRFPGI